jgi:hypothetical protein
LFFNDAVYGSGKTINAGSKDVRAAIECQDLLGKWLPELQREFLDVRKFLDAAHHINTVLLPDEGVSMDPGQIRKMFPLDVVDFVLDTNPESAILGCQKWNDPAWAKGANQRIRTHVEQCAHEQANDIPSPTVKDLPKLPGAPIYHLAQLLELEDSSSVIAVKARVIQCLMTSSHHGAAAAVCRTLVADIASRDAVSQSLGLQIVASIVSNEEFADTETKEELCASALLELSSNLSASTVGAFSLISHEWNKIEHGCRVIRSRPNEAFVSVGRFYHDTNGEYSADIGNLFKTLYCQLFDCVVDDALLHTLARFAMFWCIGRSTRPRNQPIGSLDTLSTVEIGDLAASLLLHFQDRDLLLASIEEFSNIFHGQRLMSKQNRLQTKFADPKPDFTIVKRLMGRGYSENSARRATLMTKNVGFDDALQWAVAHTLDKDFDAPLVFLRSPKQPFFDELAAETMESLLSALPQYRLPVDGIKGKAIEGEDAFFDDDFGGLQTVATSSKIVDHPSASRALETEVAKAPDVQETSPSAIKSDNKKAGEKRTKGAMALPVPMANKESNNHAAGLKLSNGYLSDTKPNEENIVTDAISMETSSPSDHVSVEPSHPSGETDTSPNQIAGSGTPKMSNELNLKTASENQKVQIKGKLNVSSKLKVQIPTTSSQVAKVKTATSTTLEAPANVTLKSPSKEEKKPTAFKVQMPESSPNVVTSASRLERKIAPPMRSRVEVAPQSAPVPSPDRSTLLQVGQAAFQNARTAASPSNEERKRLIEEGRLLLERARSNSAEPAIRQAFRFDGPSKTIAIGSVATKLFPSAAVPPAERSVAASKPVESSTPFEATNDNGDDWDFDEDDLDL